MTSKLKCPVCPYCNKSLHCGAELNVDGHNVEMWCCTNYECEPSECLIGTREMWEIVTNKIQAKQDFEIARQALKEMQHWLGVVRCSMISHLNNQNNTLLEHYETDPTVQNIDKAKSILKQYLEQIEHKE